ncbi:MAG: L-seryl-tRNA(Sec) selenium transferase [Gammaproteobacteria bacterium]|nr:L-seryl-tRNA(Sec) selenium transferase [Gammaproteobacteria bacterium]
MAGFVPAPEENQQIVPRNQRLRSLPSVDRVLNAPELSGLVGQYGAQACKLAAQGELARLRKALRDGDGDAEALVSGADFQDRLYAAVRRKLVAEFSASLKPVFNLSGTVVHTNLGRSALPAEAVEAMATAAGACNLEYDLEAGHRGDRDHHLEATLCELTGAEAATVVNNNAAAVLLVLNTLATGREVVISRGELVEIGGSFRMPEIMQSANCILRETGTTNRTHLRDYENAINKRTALLMKVHTSNYEVRGFTNSVSGQELSQLARENGLPFVHDLGSGTLVDLVRYGLPHEPTVNEVLAEGVDLVTFSGDKLLGGPQAGIIVGGRELVDRVRRNPLKRALRVDKISIAALREVLNLYKDPQRLSSRLPMLADLTRSAAEILALGERLLKPVAEAFGPAACVALTECKSQIGSGALPLERLESTALQLTPIAEKGGKDAALQRLAGRLRELPRPVIGRIRDGSLLLDLRCLRDEERFLAQLRESAPLA